MAVANGRAFFAKRPRIHQEMPAIIPRSVVVRYRAACLRITLVFSFEDNASNFWQVGKCELALLYQASKLCYDK